MKIKNLNFKSIYILLLLTTIGRLDAQEISDNKFGKGMINFIAKDSSYSVKFAPRIQTRYQSQWDYNEGYYDDPEYNFLVRRARLKFDGLAFSPKLIYKIELGLSLIHI